MNRTISFLLIALLFVGAVSCSTESTPAYKLTTTVNPTEGGEITPNAGTFDEGEAVSLEAVPAEGWQFSRWEQDLNSTANPMNITMNRDYNVVGVFEQRMHALTIDVEGEGTVSETVVQQKTTDYAEGTVVELEAVPDDNWVFSHWEGDVEGDENPVTIEVTDDANVTAVFVRDTFEISYTLNGEGEVTETLTSGTKYGDGSYAYESEVEVAAATSKGWEFTGWSGDLEGTANPQIIVINAEKSVTANFEQRDYQLTITVEGQGTVTETIVQAKTTEYPVGTIIELMAHPDSDWSFARWEGDLSGAQNPTEITIDQPINILAVFNTLPTVSTSPISSINLNSAQGGGNVNDDGGAEVTARGICWSTLQNPTTSDECTSDGSGTGSFTSSLTNLTQNTEYFVRAYAINAEGTAYGNQQEFRTESESWSIDTDTEVVDVTNPATGETWMDRNLGASRAATSSTDEEAYGDLYQWGRPADGHQKRTSGTTTIMSTTNQPGHGDFIIMGSNDWRNPRNNNLWQGANGINNPCPDGYRLPTEAEWDSESSSWSSNRADGAFSSPLKLPVAGQRLGSDGRLNRNHVSGNYWSSTTTNWGAVIWSFSSSRSSLVNSVQSNGKSVRCIKD